MFARRSLKQSEASVSVGTEGSSQQGGSANATANATAHLDGPGSISASARANGRAVIRVRSMFTRETIRAVSNVMNGGDALAEADIRASAYAEAVAEAFSETIAEVISTGPGGSACATAAAEAEGSASTFARVLIEVHRHARSFFCSECRRLFDRCLLELRMISPLPMPMARSRQWFLRRLMHFPKPIPMHAVLAILARPHSSALCRRPSRSRMSTFALWPMPW